MSVGWQPNQSRTLAVTTVLVLNGGLWNLNEPWHLDIILRPVYCAWYKVMSHWYWRADAKWNDAPSISEVVVGCRKCEGQWAFAGWHHEGLPACKTLHLNRLLKYRGGNQLTEVYYLEMWSSEHICMGVCIWMWYWLNFLLHCVLSLAAQCIVIGPVCNGRALFVGLLPR